MKAVGEEKVICGQEIHDNSFEQDCESSRKLAGERLHTASENDKKEVDQNIPSQLNDSIDDDHHLGIILCENSGCTRCRMEHSFQNSEMPHTSMLMNNKWPIGHNLEDNLNPCSQTKSDESNVIGLEETGLSESCAPSICDSSAVLISPLHVEPSEICSSLPTVSLSILPNRGPESSLSLEDLSANRLHRTSNLLSNKINDEIKVMPREKKDEERGTTRLEMEKSTHKQEGIYSVPLELRESNGDSLKVDSTTLVVTAKISDSNDSPVSNYKYSSKEAEGAPHNSFEETIMTNKIEKEGMDFPPANLESAVNSPASKDKGAFVLTGAVIDEKQDIGKQGCGSGLPAMSKHMNESSNSLRMLLSSEASDRVDKQGSLIDRFRKDREAFEHLHRIVPSSETGRSVDHLSQDESHIFPEKWYEDSEDHEITSANFSSPIAYSGPIPTAYSGPISGTLSNRSDSSTSARSFAFPILATDWTSSPVKMAQPDSRFFQRRKRWRFSCFCCRQSSTLYN